MTTSMALAPTTRDLPDSPDVEHGVHVECQIDAPFVIASCGVLLDWIEGMSGGRERDPMCDSCLAVDRCPLCGHMFEPGGWR